MLTFLDLSAGIAASGRESEWKFLLGVTVIA
jgi:hypothetical protein